MPTIEVLRPNFTRVTVGGTDYYFSYSTCVAFRPRNHMLVVSENVWSRTTGKHLNSLPDNRLVLPYEEFVAQLRTVSEKGGA